MAAPKTAPSGRRPAASRRNERRCSLMRREILSMTASVTVVWCEISVYLEMTDNEISEELGLSVSTFYRWREEHAELSPSYSSGVVFEAGERGVKV